MERERERERENRQADKERKQREGEMQKDSSSTPPSLPRPGGQTLVSVPLPKPHPTCSCPHCTLYLPTIEGFSPPTQSPPSPVGFGEGQAPSTGEKLSPQPLGCQPPPRCQALTGTGPANR